MSVLVSDRKTSKYEAITYSAELHNALTELMQRNFGVKDIDHIVRVRYAYGLDEKEDFQKYRWLMDDAKKRIEFIASLMTSNLRSAYSRYPVSLHEYERRRDFQNDAIANCEQIKKELQRVVELFDVDLNVYERTAKAINREIDLIKEWRGRDNRIKSQLKG